MGPPDARRAAVCALLAAALVAGCGGVTDKPAAGGHAGTPATPAIKTAPANEVSVAGAGGGAAASAANAPCRLVTRGEARTILGAAVARPVTAPQGPTCVYRTRNGRQMVTLAVQPRAYQQLFRQLRDRKRVPIGRRAAVCGDNGQAVLYLPLGSSGVLTVAAPCREARAFAGSALRRLGA